MKTKKVEQQKTDPASPPTHILTLPVIINVNCGRCGREEIRQLNFVIPINVLPSEVHVSPLNLKINIKQ